MLPNLTRIRDILPFPVPLKIDITALTGPGWNVRYWTRSLKRLCITIYEASAIAPPRFTSDARFQNIWTKLKVTCPNMEELTIVVPRSRYPMVNLNDLVDIPAGFPPQQLAQMVGITVDLSRVQGQGGLSNLRPKFHNI